LGSPSGNLASRSLRDSLRGSLVLATYTGMVRLDTISVTAPPFSILQNMSTYIYIYIYIYIYELMYWKMEYYYIILDLI
jgi:hypothetical protein